MEISLGLILNVAITIYLIIDAPKHGKSPVLWGILGFIFGLLPLGIYLIITGRKVAGWIIVVLSILSVILIFLLLSVLIAFLFSAY